MENEGVRSCERGVAERNKDVDTQSISSRVTGASDR